jgi:hypothetical protein
MKTSYTPLSKEPITLKMSVEDLLTLRFCLNESIEKIGSVAIHADQMSKYDPQYKKIAKSARRDKRNLERVLKDLRKAV